MGARASSEYYLGSYTTLKGQGILRKKKKNELSQGHVNFYKCNLTTAFLIKSQTNVLLNPLNFEASN